jgi:hypothetical protein
MYMNFMFIAAEKCQNLKKRNILYFLLKLCVHALQFRNGIYLPPEIEKERHISLVLTFLRTLWRDRTRTFESTHVRHVV